MKDKSMINMAGTSMGSYNKPMMKGGKGVYISKSMPKFDSKDSTKTDSTNIKGGDALKAKRIEPMPVTTYLTGLRERLPTPQPAYEKLPIPLPNSGKRQMPTPLPLPKGGERQMLQFLNQKTSGVKMCGSQVGKHMKMGGPKMMGGDEKKGFRESFAANKKAGKKEFEYEGKMYNTKTAEDVAKGLNDKDLYKAYERAYNSTSSFDNVPGSEQLESRNEIEKSYFNEGRKRELKQEALDVIKKGMIAGAVPGRRQAMKATYKKLKP